MTKKTLFLCLLAGAGLSLSAQIGLVAKAGLVKPIADLKKASAKPFGFHAEAGYEFSPKDYGVTLLVYGRFMYLQHEALDKPGSRNVRDLALGLNVMHEWQGSGMVFRLGPELHKWRIRDPRMNPETYATNGYKLGFRAGLDWNFSKTWLASLDYSLAEARSTSAQVLTDGINPLNPSGFALQVGRRF